MPDGDRACRGEGTPPERGSALAFGATQAPNVLAPDGAHGRARPRRRCCRSSPRSASCTGRCCGRHDINYYLSQRPPEFWVAVAHRRGDRRRAGSAARADDRPLGARAAARPVRGRPAPAGARRERQAVVGQPLGDRGGRSHRGRSSALVLLTVATWLRRGHRPRPGAAPRRLAGGAAAVHRGAGCSVGRVRPRGGRSSTSRCSRWSSSGSTCTSASRGSPRVPEPASLGRPRRGTLRISARR